MSPSAAKTNVGTRLKIVFVVFGALSLAGILGFKAYQVFVEPDAMSMRYLGIDPLDAPAPDIVLENHDGKPVKLSDYRGKLVFLNFWATWCDSCRIEMPSMARLGAQLKGERFAMLAVTVDDSWAPVDAFFRGRAVAFDILRDPDSKWAKELGTSKFPETYLVGPDGRLRGKFVGPRDWSDRAFELYFRKVLADLEPPPTK